MTSRSHPNKARFFLVAVSMPLLLGACAGSTHKGSQPSPTPSPTTSQVSEQSPANLTACGGVLRIGLALNAAKNEGPTLGFFIGETGTVNALSLIANSAGSQATGPIASGTLQVAQYMTLAAQGGPTNSAGYLLDDQRTSALTAAQAVMQACNDAGYSADQIKTRSLQSFEP